ncbi:MAG: hypothetical protein IKS71_05360 [Bacteroidales bacterium]|nr:hypothetical protein [Bacteroidales bacterium]
MKKINIAIVLVAALSLLSLTKASAQSFRSGYFLDNYVYGYRINPAQIGPRSFFALGLGSIDLQNNLNIGMGSLLFPTENGMVTGFNKAVSADDFLGGIPNGVRLSLDENINILSFGIAKENRMSTFEINFRTMVGLALPHDLFAFLKLGGDQPYDISGLGANVGVIADVAYGFAHKVGDNLTIGGRLHFLAGVADAKLYTANSNITMGSTAELNTEIHLETSGIASIGIDSEGNIDPNSLALTGPYVGGYGGGLDLGIEFEPFDGFTLTASVTDFGILFRNNTTNLAASSKVTYKGADINYQEDGSVKADFDAVLEELRQAIVFQEVAGEAQRMDILPFNAQAGLRYKLPFFKPLSFGVLGTWHYDTIAPWYEARGGVTLTPFRLISISANAGYGSLGGPVCGGALDLHLGPLNILAGFDTFLGDMGLITDVQIPPYNGIPIPLHGFNLNAHVGVGLTF